MFIVALFTIVRPWKQPKCPSTEEWIKKMWYTLLYVKQITNKGLLHSTGNSAQPSVAAWMGEEFGGEWIHV